MEPVRLFVGNIPLEFDENLLKREFSHYGSVKNVEIKQKRGLETDSKKFGFITIEADNYSVKRCVQEFSETDLNGHRLTVSVAKESFMDRLKREREAEALKKTSSPQDGVSAINSSTDTPEFNRKKKKFNTEENEISFSTPNIDYDLQKSKRNSTFEKSVLEKKFQKDFNKNESSPYSKKHDNSQQRKSDVNIARDASKDNLKQDVDDKITSSEIKRLESLKNMKAEYNAKRKMIQNALSNVDQQKKNKITFHYDDDGDAIDEENDTSNLSTGLGGKQSKSNKNTAVEKKKVKKVKSSQNNGNKLFDEESEEEDSYNFELKPQFEGESGQKLMELQSRFKADRRFIIDERFAEENENANEGEADEENLVDTVDDCEKTKQLEILNNILGTSSKPVKDTNKKGPLKTMLRYDPMRSDHSKFIHVSTKTEEKSTKKRARDKTSTEAVETEQQKPIVSTERYYKVDQSLKTSMENKNPFSLLSLFGNNAVEEETTREEYSVKKIEKKTNRIGETNGNPFFYDSPDSDNENDVDLNAVKKESSDSVPNTNVGLSAVERLFFSQDDSRLKEGLEFFLGDVQISNEPRDKLKFMVKKRIQNNMRNEKYQAKKGTFGKGSYRPIRRFDKKR